MSGPLQGLRVIDLSRLIPGGYATMLLADLGADVVKVEQPGVGDDLRSSPELHELLNRGKRSLTCNLKVAAGQRVFLRLLSTADLLVESFRPGVLQRLGVGPARLAAACPRLVHVSISAYGSIGPYAGRPAHDLNVAAVTGALCLARAVDGAPAPPGLQVADVATGLQAALGALAALHAAAHDPGYRRVDVAMSDAMLSFLPVATSTALTRGRPPRPGDEALTGALACYDTYRCADGRFIAVAALEAKFFRRLCQLLGRPDLAPVQHDPAAQPHVRAVLAETFAARPLAEWVDLLADEDTCVTPVRDVSEAFADSGVGARAVLTPGVGGAGSGPQVGLAIRLSRSPRSAAADVVVPAAAPALGEHTDAVLSAAGYSPEEIARLRAAGVL